MKILLEYLKPYKWLVFLVLFLAAINIGFSLVDPYIFGKLVNLANDYFQAKKDNAPFEPERYYWSFSWTAPGVIFLLVCSITVAMISRIAKKFPGLFFECSGAEIWS